MGRKSKPSSGYESCFKKSIIDIYNIIGSDCSRARVDEEPPLFATNVDELVLQPSVDWMMMGGGNDCAFVLCVKR